MFYNSSKIRGRSTELVGALFKGPRLKLLIGGVILLAVAVTATMAGIFTNVSEAQPQPPAQTGTIGFDTSTPHIAVVNDGTKSFTSTVTTTLANVHEATIATVTVGVLDGTLSAGEMVTLSLSTADGNVETELARLAAGGITETHLTAAGINREELVAKAGIDYVAISGMTIILSNTNPTMDIPITILTTDNDDDVLSPDKIFSVVLSETSLPDGFTLDPVRSRTDVAIRDNEVAIAFEERSYEVREDAGSVEVCVRVSHPDSSVEIPLTGGTAIIGVVTTVPGTATENHYTRRAGFDIALFFDNAGRRECFDIDITDNDVLDGARFKEFYLTLENDPFTAPPTVYDPFDPIRNRVKITIEDDDPAIIGFADTEYRILENGGQVEVSVEVKEGQLAEPLTVRLTTVDGLAKSPDDYIHTEEDLVLSPTQLQDAAVIPINLDRIFEGAERFEVVVSNPLPVGIALDPSAARATVVIEDEVIVTIGFVNAPYEVGEGAGGQTVTVAILSEGSVVGEDLTLEVDLKSSDMSALAGEDYQEVSRTVVFDPQTNQRNIWIPITDDMLLESDEIFNLSLSNPRTLLNGARQSAEDEIANQLNPGTAKVTITDNDLPNLIGFEQTEYTVTEGTDLVLTTVVRASRGALYGTATAFINFNTFDDSAISGADFDGVSNHQITFNNSNDSQDVNVNILNDAVIEARSESFIAVLSPAHNTTLPPGVELDPNGMTATVTIMDDDKATFGLDSPRFGVFESDGSVRITIDLLAGALDTPIPVNYRIEPGSARNGDDYTGAMEGTVIFNVGGARSQFIDIPIINDNVPEAHESFRVVLSDGPQIELATAETLVEILNDDIATIRFDQTSYTASETGANPNIAITSDVALPTGLTLAVSTVDGTAMAGEDYTALDNMNVVLSTGDTSAIVNVSITNDNLIEFDETFEVVLSAPDGGLPSWVELDPIQSRVPVKIESEDTATVVFDEASYMVNEDASTVDVTFGFEDGVMLGDNLEVTVNYGVSVQDAGTATAGEDYELATRDSIVLTAMNRRATVSIPILDDDLYEGDETFAIALLGSSHPDLEASGKTQVTIKDNDSVTVDFIGPDSYTVNEGDGPVAVTFGITAGTLAANATVTVSYTIPFSGNTADVDDYTAGGDTVILSADMPEVTIEIPIIDDSKPEGDEQFVIIVNFGGAPAPSVRTITIKDDDPPGIIGLSYSNNNPTGEVDENDGTIRLDFGADPALAGSNVTLNYVIEPGSATAGADYTDGSGTLDLTDFFLDISIRDDSVPESVERFVVRLSLAEGSELPPGYSLGPDLEVTIIDDDGVTLIGFTQAAYEVTETLNAAVGFEVAALGAALTEEVTLEYKIEDGTAKAGQDISIASRTGTITLSSSDSSESISAFIQQDIVAEYDETFVIRLSIPDGTSLPANTELYRDTTEVTIVSEDSAAIGFQETTVRQNEGADAMVTIAVLTGSLGDNTEVTVGYSITDDTTVSGQDYTVAINGTRTFSGSQLVHTIVIPLTDDDRYEGSTDERFVVTLFEMSETPLEGLDVAPSEVEVLIGDNDLPEVTLLPENIRVMENAGTDRTLRATIPFPFDEDLELTLARFHDDDDATVNEDFGTYQVPATVTIPTGDTEVVIEVPLTDDIIAEVEKVLLVGVTHFNYAGLAQPYEYPLAERPSAAVTIVHDDTLILNLESSDNVPRDGSTDYSYQVCVTFSNPLQYVSVGRPQTLMLEIRVRNSDGTPGELYPGEIIGYDSQSYIGVPVPLTPIEGDTQGCVELEFEENEYYEGQRIYDIDLLGHPGLDRSIEFGDVSSDVTVAENDLPELALNYGGTTEIAEGQTIDVDLELTNGGPEGLHEPLTVRLALTTTSSASTSDVSIPTSVTIGRGMSSATFQITARDDMLNNEDEQFTLALVNASVPSMTELITRAVFSSGGAIAVSEVKLPQITLSASPASVTEGNSVRLTAMLTDPLITSVPEELTLELVRDASSTADTNDYGTLGNIVIPMNGNMRTVDLMIKDDDLAEFAETLRIRVAQLGYGTNRSAPADEISVDLTIETDPDDRITATIKPADTTTDESGVATVNVELDRALPAGLNNDDVKLVLVGTDRTADVKSGLPASIATDLMGDEMATVMITLEDDKLLEDTEQVTLQLELSDKLKPVFTNADSTRATFDINDNEGTAVSIAAPPKNEYPEDEDVELTFALPTDVLASAPIRVNYRIEFVDMDGNGNTRAAASTADITGGTVSGSATIPANQNSISVTIDLNDDSDAEETELFKVYLDSVVADIPATRDATPRIVAILDKGETLAYSFVGTGQVDEGGNDYTVRLRRVGELPAGGDDTVAFTTSGSGSSPANAADFVANAFPSGDFVFTGYAAESAPFTLAAVADDQDIEGDKTFQIMLTGRTETHPVTLADNDSPKIDIERVAGPGPVNEGDSIQFRARLVNGPMSGATEDITVNLAVGLTSTVFADDVSFPQRSITIQMGTSDMTFMVNVRDDELAEFAEQVRIVAESVDTSMGNNLNTGRGYDLEIESNDPIEAKISVDDTTEGDMARVRITLDRLLPDRTPADVLSLVLLSGGTMNADVRIISKDITTELETSLTTDVMIQLIDDKLLEGNETVRVMLRIEPGMSPDLATLLPDLPSASFEITDNESPIVSLVPPPDSEYYESVGGNNGAAQTVDFEFKLAEGVIADIPVVVYYSMGVAEIGSGSETAFVPGLAPGFAQGVALPVRGLAQVPRLSLTILPGKNSVTLTVTLPDDDKAEVTELLTVRLDDVQATGAPRIQVDERMDETVITILDDEDPVLEIIGSGEIDEDDGGYTVRLRRLGRIDQDGKIPYTIVGRGADEGDFVGALTGEFEFDGYEPVSKQVILILNDDNSVEESKPFQISVENPMTKAYASVPIVDPVTGVVFTSITLIDSDVAGLLGDLPPTGGPVLPVWLLLVLLLTGVALLVPALKLNR